MHLIFGIKNLIFRNMSVPFSKNNFVVYVLCILYIWKKRVRTQGQEIMEYVYMGHFVSKYRTKQCLLLWCACLIIRIVVIHGIDSNTLKIVNSFN